MRPWLVRLLGVTCLGYGVEALTFSVADRLAVVAYVESSLFILVGVFMLVRTSAIIDHMQRVRSRRGR